MKIPAVLSSSSLMKTLKIRRDETGKLLVFVLIQSLLSLIIALLTTGIDSLYFNHYPDRFEIDLYRFIIKGEAISDQMINHELTTLLFFLGSVFLLLAGFLYTARTDRGVKWHKMAGGFIITSLLSLLFIVIISVEYNTGLLPPFSYSLMYIWRFTGGIIYLMLFWDLASIYFDSRSSKRLYPLMAICGTLAYSIGSLMAVPMVENGKELLLLWFVLILSVSGLPLMFFFKKKIRPVVAVRYRNTGIFEEFYEGLKLFSSNPYLKVMGLGTVVFGLTSGFIMFTYNELIMASDTFSMNSGRFLALQRASASFIQSILFVTLMKQGTPGKNWVTQVLSKMALLIFSILAFLVSMLGVADFSRSVCTALMSPVTMASFAIIPYAYRGRALVLNNMVFASLGIMLASLIIFILDIQYVLFLIVILILLLSRILINIILNKGYIKALKIELTDDKSQMYSLSDEQIILTLSDKSLLKTFMDNLSSGSDAERLFLWQRLSRLTDTREKFDSLAKWSPEAGDIIEDLWIRLAGKLAGSDYKDYFTGRSDFHTSAGLSALIESHKVFIEEQSDEALVLVFELLSHLDHLILEEDPAYLSLIPVLSEISPEHITDYVKKLAEKQNGDMNVRLLSTLKKNPRKEVVAIFIEKGCADCLPAVLDYMNLWQDWSSDFLENLFIKYPDKDARTALLKNSGQYSGEDVKLWRRNKLDSWIEILSQSESSFEIEGWIEFTNKALNLYMTDMIRQMSINEISQDPGLLKTLSSQSEAVMKGAALFFCLSHYNQDNWQNNNYAPLLKKMFLEEFVKCRDLYLALTVLAVGNSQIRAMAADLLNDSNLESQIPLILELLENAMDKKIFKNILYLIDPMSGRDRASRLKSLGGGISLQMTLSAFKTKAVEGSLREVIAGYF